MTDVCAKMMKELVEAEDEFIAAESVSSGPLDTDVLFAAIHLGTVAEYLMMHCEGAPRKRLVKLRLAAVTARLKWEKAIDPGE